MQQIKQEQQNDVKNRGNRRGFEIEGHKSDVKILLQEVEEDSKDPQKFVSSEKNEGATTELIAEIQKYMKDKYSGPGDLISIKKDGNNGLKIVGFKHA